MAQGLSQVNLNTDLAIHRLTSALREGLTKSRFHLTDAKSNAEPEAANGEIGWCRGVAQGASIGWYDPEKDLAYLKSEVQGASTHVLLLEHMRDKSPTIPSVSNPGPKQFWGEAKRAGLLVKSEEKRNTTRLTIQGHTEYAYCIRLGLKEGAKGNSKAA